MKFSAFIGVHRRLQFVIALRAHIWAAAALGMPTLACAHAFDDRYDLPAPLSYFMTGAALVVILSFAIAQVVVDRATGGATAHDRVIRTGPLLPLLRAICRVLAFLIFALILAAGFYGTTDPQMNFAPTAVWIVWWVGLSLIVACVANIWPALDPWRTLFDAIDSLARLAGRRRGIALGWRYPRKLGAWPAVVLLLALSWFEVAYPQAAVPYRLACVILAWSGVTLLGMLCFGADIWQRNADVFALYFATLGRFAPIAAGPDARSVVLRAPGRGLIDQPAASFAMVCFVIAMLSTVLFDGLLSGQAWPAAQSSIARALPFMADADGYRMGAFGLVAVWLVFLGAYLLTCWITSLLAPHDFRRVVFLFALTLVPIAIAYNIAHNCATLLVQGQQLIALASDPFGVKWDLFGTANFRPDIALVDARTSWYVAIGAIVGGHAISIWLAHRVALGAFGTQQRAGRATVALTALMVTYTVVSLAVIAEPMVVFTPPDAVISR